MTNGGAGWAAPLLVIGRVFVMESEAGNGERPGVMREHHSVTAFRKVQGSQQEPTFLKNAPFTVY